MRTIVSHLPDRVLATLEHNRLRREHDAAMRDARIRDEHYHARARDVRRGQPDCEFCA